RIPISVSLTGPVHHRELHSFPTRRSSDLEGKGDVAQELLGAVLARRLPLLVGELLGPVAVVDDRRPVGVPVARRTGEVEEVEHRSEEHTSELQSRFDLVCRLLLEKKKNQK